MGAAFYSGAGAESHHRALEDCQRLRFQAWVIMPRFEDCSETYSCQLCQTITFPCNEGESSDQMSIQRSGSVGIQIGVPCCRFANLAKRSWRPAGKNARASILRIRSRFSNRAIGDLQKSRLLIFFPDSVTASAGAWFDRRLLVYASPPRIR
jgi:hypothetical protein